MVEGKYTTVSLPRPLYEKAKKVIEGTGFTSVSDFVTFVLRDLVGGGAEKRKAGSGLGRVRRRLKALGYF